jgi:hypothetical protein
VDFVCKTEGESRRDAETVRFVCARDALLASLDYNVLSQLSQEEVMSISGQLSSPTPSYHPAPGPGHAGLNRDTLIAQQPEVQPAMTPSCMNAILIDSEGREWRHGLFECFDEHQTCLYHIV